VLSGLGLWALLLLVLPESRRDGVRAAGWLASFALQLALAGVLTSGLELAIDHRRAAPARRFSILFLFIWMTLVGCLLAAARQLAARFGWTLKSFFSWDYFLQLQALAVANAVMAVGVLAGVRLNPTWYIRCGACVLAVVVVTTGTALAMLSIFRNNIGVSLNDLIWLSAIQGLFLIVTLVPLEFAGGHAHISK
jgi:hypothetical protein